MQRCQFCGSEFPDTARFCGNCGRTPVSNAASYSYSTPSPSVSIPEAFTPSSQGNQPGAQGVEERRRGAILPLPVPPWPEGSLTGWQVPQVQGTPSFSGVPTVQGTSPGIAGSPPPSYPSYPAGSAASAPPGVSPAGQPGTFQQLAGTNPPIALHDGSTDIHGHRPPEHDHQGKPRHQRHREPRVHHGQHAAGSTSKAAIGGTTKLILIALVGLLVVVGGASALVFALRSHSPGPGGATPATTPGSVNRNASATACAKAPGVPCSGTVPPSSTVASGQSTGTFSFAGAVPGSLVITSFPACGVQGTTYVMQVLGTVGGTQYKFLIGIVSYHGPATYTSHLTINLLQVGGIGNLDNDGRLPVNITVTNGGKAGTVSSDLEGILKVTQTQLSTGHVSGSWTCA